MVANVGGGVGVVAAIVTAIASVTAVTRCLDYLQTRTHDWDIVAVATVQEENGMLGAITCPIVGIIAALPLLWLLDLQGTTAMVFMVFAVLPPAVLNFMVSERFNQEPQRVASIVLLGNLFALVPIPVMLGFLL